MSKIICDVCGTAFPENAAQCPICGSAKRKNPVNDNIGDSTKESGYKTVRGGRFSKRNVRKRNQEAARQNQTNSNEDGQEEQQGNKGLMFLMFLLIGAVIAVFLYIVLRIFGPAMPPEVPTEPSGTTAPTGTIQTDPTTVPTTAPTTAPTDPADTTVPCESLVLNVSRIELNSIVRTAAINVTASPVNTTDKITYSSSNKSVAIVDEYGNVSAIGDGNATITISCGQYQVECIVFVSLSDVPTTAPTTEPTTAPTTEPTTAPTKPAKTYTISHKDVSIKIGETFRLTLRDSDGNTVDVNWKVTKPGYVNISGNKITGVKSINDSSFTVYTTIDGKTYSCIVRVK